METWHVTLFTLRSTKGGTFRRRRRVVTGYGWSASGSEGGYQYHDQVCDSPEEALATAQGVIAELGGTVGSTSSDLTGSTSRETKHPASGHHGPEGGTVNLTDESNVGRSASAADGRTDVEERR